MRRNVGAALALTAGTVGIAALLLLPAGGAIWNTAAVLVFQKQQEMQQALASGLRTVDQTGPMAAFGLIGLSFLYGVIHALGPGHGKAVVSAYVLADGRSLRQGLAVAWAASALQALVAISLVTVVVLIFGAAARETQTTTLALERLGYGLVVVMGAFLSGAALYRVLAGWAVGRHHCHSHHNDISLNLPPNGRERLKRGLVVLSAGIRPCSGAVLVLAFAKAIGVFVVGILATIAMSVGTALTVSALAIVTMLFRRTAVGMIDEGSHVAGAVESGLGLFAGVFLLILGSLLLWGSFTVPVSPFRV